MKKILLALTGALMLFAQTLRAEAVLTVDALGNGVFALIGQTGGRLYENHGLNANYGVIDTPQGSILIDSGASSVAAKVLETEVRELTGKAVKWVINTGSQDHRWLGNAYFGAQGAQIIALQRTATTQARLGKGQIEALARDLKEQMDGTVPAPAAQPLAGDTQTLTLGGRTLELRYFDHAHFAGDAVVWLPQEKILFSGDHIYVDRLLGILPESNAETWLKAFRQAIALQPQRIVPGHGRVCDVAQAQRETGDYLAFVVNDSRKLAEEMAGVDAAVAALQDAPAFAGLKNFADLHRGNVNRTYLRIEAGQ
ncbi:MBL fold metallo-hydrolase [Azonexus sp.]|uniref:MBL fold metallo-hydrolase n=1 Tax=Azonexus sp. TaxID=1872668 RepID=UPI0035AEFA80